MQKIFGLEIIENSALPPGWIVLLNDKEAVATHPEYKPVRFDFSRPQLGWQTIGED